MRLLDWLRTLIATLVDRDNPDWYHEGGLPR